MIARLIESCARNRFLVMLTVAVACGAGFWAVRHIPLDAVPDLSDPQVILFTEWMGRSPDLVEDQVTYPIVSSLLSAPKVAAVRGYSMFGMSFIYVIFDEGTDLYWARSRVMEYMNTIRAKLPRDVSPALGPDATAIGWAFQYALVDTTGAHDLSDLRAFQDFSLRYALSSVPGVAEVASVGGFQKQYQVAVDPVKLHAYRLSLEDVTRAIRRSNNDVGGRVLEMAGREYFIRGRGYIQSTGAIEDIALGTDPASGTPVLIGNVATVTIGPDIRRGVTELDGIGEAVGGTVIVRYHENALRVIERVKEKLHEIEASFPPGVGVQIVYDRSALIHRSIETLRHTLIEEAIVVSLVILLFLLHVRSSIVAVLTLPIGVALAFIPMHAMGLSSNIMSLGGIAIAIGAMVDAAIVLIENAHKHLEKAPPGADRTQIVIDACKEVGPPIFFSLLIIVVAFIPIFALNGQAGRLFQPLAYTKTFAMFFAALLSVTLTPALMTLLVRGRVRHEADHPVSRALIAAYRPFVYVALRNPRTTVLIGLVAVITAIPMFQQLGSEFMPPLNEGDVLYMPTTFPNISIEEAKEYLQRQDRILRSFPEVVSVFGKAGRSETSTDPAPLSMVETVVQLKPRGEWRMVAVPRWYSSWMPGWLTPPFRVFWPDRKRISWDGLMGEFNTAMQFPGWTNAWTMPIKTRVDMLSTGVRTPVGVKVFGPDLNEVERIGMQLEHALTPIRGTRSVYSDRSTGGFYIDIVPDRKAIARYGLTVGDVEDVIEAAVGGQPIEITVEGRNRFSINVRYPRDLRQDVERLKQVLIPVRGSRRTSTGAAPAMGGMSSSLPASVQYADAGMGGASTPAGGMDTRTDAGPSITLPMPASAMGAQSSMSDGADAALPRATSGSTSPSLRDEGSAHVPLGQVADIRIVEGPPMIRDEGGLLAGYVYVDIDQGQRDIGGYVKEAKAKAAREITLPPGYYLKWTGQYELLEQVAARMRIVIPVTLFLVFVLLYLNFHSVAEAAIVMASVPFALVGSIWLLWALHYHLSTATWVGIIALLGLAAETGIVMIVYLDSAFHRAVAEGRMRSESDLFDAVMEGAVQRVRPKLMTVATMMIGLLPLLWSQGSGADVMKRIAAPMVGGLATSAFLTLEIIPVVYLHWRRWQLREKFAVQANGG